MVEGHAYPPPGRDTRPTVTPSGYGMHHGRWQGHRTARKHRLRGRGPGQTEVSCAMDSQCTANDRPIPRTPSIKQPRAAAPGRPHHTTRVLPARWRTTQKRICDFHESRRLAHMGSLTCTFPRLSSGSNPRPQPLGRNDTSWRDNTELNEKRWGMGSEHHSLYRLTAYLS